MLEIFPSGSRRSRDSNVDGVVTRNKLDDLGGIPTSI